MENPREDKELPLKLYHVSVKLKDGRWKNVTSWTSQLLKADEQKISPLDVVKMRIGPHSSYWLFPGDLLPGIMWLLRYRTYNDVISRLYNHSKKIRDSYINFLKNKVKPSKIVPPPTQSLGPNIIYASIRTDPDFAYIAHHIDPYNLTCAKALGFFRYQITGRTELEWLESLRELRRQTQEFSQHLKILCSPHLQQMLLSKPGPVSEVIEVVENKLRQEAKIKTELAIEQIDAQIDYSKIKAKKEEERRLQEQKPDRKLFYIILPVVTILTLLLIFLSQKRLISNEVANKFLVTPIIIGAIYIVYHLNNHPLFTS